MATLTTVAQNVLIDALLRRVTPVFPSIYYVALVTTAGPSNALAGVEVAGGAYARASVPASLAAWSGTQGDGSTGASIGLSTTTSNNVPISFPAPTANWGNIVGYELWDAMVNGNRWLHDTLTVPMTVSVGDPAPTFPPGTLRISFI